MNTTAMYDPQRRKHLSLLWSKRLEYQPTQDLEQWQKSLNIRNLVIDKSEDIDYYLKFSKLAQDNGNNEFGQRILKNLKSELSTRVAAAVADKTAQPPSLTNQLAKVDLAIYETYFNSGIYAKTSLNKRGGGGANVPVNAQQQVAGSTEVENAINSLTRLIQEKEKDMALDPVLKSECYLKLG